MRKVQVLALIVLAGDQDLEEKEEYIVLYIKYIIYYTNIKYVLIIVWILMYMKANSKVFGGVIFLLCQILHGILKY